MKFSIVLASRERSQLLINFVKSIEATTHNLNNIEVLVGIDDDDVESQNCVKQIKEWYPNWFFWFSRPRSEYLNRDYLNWVYDTTGRKGDAVIIVNDDCEFRTKDWDVIIEKRLTEYLADKPDGIAYAYFSDGLIDRHGMGYCCFPLVTKAGVEALGFAIINEFKTWNADIAIWNCYNSVGRICDISEVLILHISYHSSLRDRDQVSHRVGALASHQPHVPMGEYQQRLAEAIMRGKK